MPPNLSRLTTPEPGGILGDRWQGSAHKTPEKDLIDLRVLIIGVGKVGYTLAETLSLENHDVTIIDNDENALMDAAERLDVMYVKGSGASLSTQRQAGAEHANVVIAVTKSDEVNMLCCITAKKLGAKRTVARIRDPEYALDSGMFMSHFEIDFVINPERSTADEILRLLRFPAAVEIDVFHRGRVEIIGFRVVPNDAITGLSLSDLRKKMKAQVLVCTVERSGALHIPRGDFIILDGDLVYVAGKDADITRFFRSIGRATAIADNAMILGGGRTSYYLASSAVRVGIKPVILESDEKKCEQLAENVPQATVICGDGTEQDLLESENIRKMDAFVSLTGSDEENLMLSLYANRCGVRKVVAKADRLNYAPLVNSLGVDSIVSPNEITTGNILHFIRGLSGARGGAIVSLRRLLDGRVEALEFQVGIDMWHLGAKIKDLPIKRGVLIAVISRGDKSIIPEGEDIFKVGDYVIVVTTNTGFDELNDIFEGH